MAFISTHENASNPRWLAAAAGLALFWVIFLWNFWERGVFALGINAAVFLLLALALFLRPLRAARKITSRDIFWIAPFVLMAISYAVYNNPFWQLTSLLVVPITFAVFYLRAFAPADVRWAPSFLGRAALRCLSIAKYFSVVIEKFVSLVAPHGASRRRVLVRAIIGVVILIIIAVAVVIPLLASSDAVFGTAVDAVYEWLKDFVFLSFWYRAFAFLAFSILFSAALFAWGRPLAIQQPETAKRLDSIIVGIVLGGILILYLLFLGIQFNRLWVGELPFDFKETELLVKSGFWQLLFLSLLNIGVYFFTYKKTSPVVQRVLAAFTGASLLLLASAGYRMGLYVKYYGFSYEKFFASYAVLYCAILFAWLIVKLFARTPADILKFVAALFLWMYAIAAVFPVEQFILRANVALAEHQDSRIRLFEMTMLSPDVLSTVKQLNQAGRLKENAGYLSREEKLAADAKPFDWQPWIESQEQRIADKRWYEYNLTSMLR